MANEIKNGKAGLIGIIVQAGAVGLALVAMWGAYNLASNHIAHNTEVLIRVEQTSEAQLEVVSEQTEILKEIKDELRATRLTP